MAPIPVYANSPITAAKADGVTPKTASIDDACDAYRAASSPPTSTTYTPSTHAAIDAQPGAVPSLPKPTGAAVAQPCPPLQPTPTTTIPSAGPASPQPGSAPVSSIPPPPQANERYQPSVQTPAPPVTTTPYPHQMNIPAPAAPQPSQQRGTSTTMTAPSLPYGNQIPSATTGIDGSGAQGLSHPPGYQQNANASELDQYQRSAVGQGELDSDDSIWGAAKRLAQQTGQRLAAVEGEVWKKINKE
ncbi:hypothetical protein F4802DRAFT_347367 [Xylaria palmicola]|nr:hypothetical protein F4802DRAFT_347367 [Xylaria palmicola]